MIAQLFLKCKHCLRINDKFAHVREKEGWISVQPVEKSPAQAIVRGKMSEVGAGDGFGVCVGGNGHGHLLDDDIGGVQTVPCGFGACQTADKILGFQNCFIQAPQLGLVGNQLVDDAEFEGTHGVLFVNGVLLVLNGQLTACLQVTDDLAQVSVDALVALEADVHADAEDEVGAKGFHIVFQCVGLLGDVDADEPIGFSALGVTVQNGVENVAVDGGLLVSGFQIHQIVAVQGQLGVIAQLLQLIDVVLHGQMVIELSFQLCAPMPDIHECQQNAGEDDGDIAPMGEFSQAGGKEHRFDHAEDHQNDHGHFEGPKEMVKNYRDYPLPEDLTFLKGNYKEEYPDYLAAIHSLDKNVGRLVDTLKEKGIYENTIIVYTSDHGCHFKTRNMEYKRSCHDSSIHTPLVFGGGAVNKGENVESLVSLIDIPPTLLSLAGAVERMGE